MSEELKPWELADEETRETFIDKAADLLRDTYICTRVWSAWGYGTMTQDDFVESYSADDRVEEVASELFEFTNTRHSPAPKPCHKDRACTFKDLQPCDDCESGGDKELVEALERIAGKVMSMHLSESHMIKTMKRIAYQALAKHKAKNN